MLQIDIIEENLERNVRSRFSDLGYDSRHFASLLKHQAGYAKGIESQITSRPTIGLLTYHSPILHALSSTLDSDEFDTKRMGAVKPDRKIMESRDYSDTGIAYKVNVHPGNTLGSFMIRDSVASERGTPGNSFMMYSVQGGFISTEREIYVHDGFMFFNHSRFLKVYLTTLEKLWRESLQRETS